MSDDKPKLPPEVLNKLMRSNEPMLADLQGPGPFQLPLLTNVESTVGPDGAGHVEIRLETQSAQEVRIVLTQEAALKLHVLLRAIFRAEQDAAKGRKN